jgi:F-type H+-transporting ATPase subunit gamma
VTRLAEIELHIAGMTELLDIVGAMRSLASMRMQEANRALPGIRRYADTMATAIGGALLLLPEPEVTRPAAPDRRALILCTAEHAFVGGFNAHILDAAEAAREEGAALFVLGSRGAVQARERGWTTTWASVMATRPESVPETIGPLTAELYRLIARGQITSVEVMFGRQRQGGPASIERQPLLPIDFAPFRLPPPMLAPLHNLAPDLLLEKLVADYVFALLTEAAVESLASENAARFAAMGSAHDNVSKRLEELRQDAREARQGEITEELLDLVTGAEAVNLEDRPVRRSQRAAQGKAGGLRP